MKFVSGVITEQVNIISGESLADFRVLRVLLPEVRQVPNYEKTERMIINKTKQRV